MPTAVTEALPQTLPQQPPRKRWTREECAKLETAGVLGLEHLELIDGELIDKMSKGRPHVDIVAILVGWLAQIFGARFVNTDAPIDVAPEDNPTNEPNPDVIVLKKSYKGFRSATPQPHQLELVIEVSDTTVAFDRGIKARLYARAGIADYWVLDVQGRRLIVHRDPRDGRYHSVASYNESESVAPLAAPQSPFPIRDVFVD